MAKQFRSFTAEHGMLTDAERDRIRQWLMFHRQSIVNSLSAFKHARGKARNQYVIGQLEHYERYLSFFNDLVAKTFGKNMKEVHAYLAEFDAAAPSGSCGK